MVSKPKFIELFSLNVEGNAVMHQVFKFWISLSIPDRDIYSDIYSYSKLEWVRNCAEFSLFFAAKIFGGAGPKIFGPAFVNWTCFWMWQSVAEIGRRT